MIYSRNDVGSATHAALVALGDLMYRALCVDGKVDFSVASRKLRDGTLVMTVLHSSGTLQFAIPKEERETAAGMPAIGA